MRQPKTDATDGKSDDSTPTTEDGTVGTSNCPPAIKVHASRATSRSQSAACYLQDQYLRYPAALEEPPGSHLLRHCRCQGLVPRTMRLRVNVHRFGLYGAVPAVTQRTLSDSPLLRV